MAGDGWDVSDVELLERVVAHYRRALDEGARAQDWLAERSITSDGVEAFGVGWSDRTLGLALPSHDRVAGRQLRGRLRALGVLRSTGHEQFRGCITVPVRDSDGRVVQVCGVRLDRPQRRGDRPSIPTDDVLWADPSVSALWHPEAMAAGEVILAGSLVEGLVWWSAGHHHVLAPGGPDGWPDDLAERLHAGGVTRALLAMARNDEGEADVASLAVDLAAVGIECFRVVFPRGGDAVLVAAEADVASDALADLLREATWLAAPATSMTEPSIPSDGIDRERPSASPVPPAPRADGFEAEGGELRAMVEDRHWRVRGLDRITGAGSLRVTVSVRTEGGERFHLDVLDLYAARARQAFIATAAGELAAEEDVLRRELGRVLMACEDRLVELGDATPRPVAPVLTTEEEAAALELLRDPSLIDRIVGDVAALGLVGETDNALVTYLAATSRLLESPLAVVVQSGSAAGKSTLTDAVLSLMPTEQCLAVSAMTGQSLFYLGETELAHKILSIAEAEGAARAAYPLKLLQSDGELSIASTGKDPASGGLVTRTYRARGPVALFLTTTAPALVDELANRCIVLGVDEDHAQTRAILAAQRAAQTLDGLLARHERARIRALHANAQRLLEPVAVVNPRAPTLGFADGRTRARRDQVKFLTLIQAVALLHQHQRPRKRAVRHGVEVTYIEATDVDVAVAERLAPLIFSSSAAELAPQSRQLLDLLDDLVSKETAAARCERGQVRFSRRLAREYTGWSDYALRRHLARLIDLELVAVHRRANAFAYQLVWEPDTAGCDSDRATIAWASRDRSKA